MKHLITALKMQMISYVLMIGIFFAPMTSQATVVKFEKPRVGIKERVLKKTESYLLENGRLNLSDVSILLEENGETIEFLSVVDFLEHCAEVNADASCIKNASFNVEAEKAIRVLTAELIGQFFDRIIQIDQNRLDIIDEQDKLDYLMNQYNMDQYQVQQAIEMSSEAQMMMAQVDDMIQFMFDMAAVDFVGELALIVLLAAGAYAVDAKWTDSMDCIHGNDCESQEDQLQAHGTQGNGGNTNQAKNPSNGIIFTWDLPYLSSSIEMMAYNTDVNFLMLTEVEVMNLFQMTAQY